MANVVFVNYVPLKCVCEGVEIRLHTENQHPRCPGSGLKVCGGWVLCKPDLVNSIDQGSS